MTNELDRQLIFAQAVQLAIDEKFGKEGFVRIYRNSRDVISLSIQIKDKLLRFELPNKDADITPQQYANDVYSVIQHTVIGKPDLSHIQVRVCNAHYNKEITANMPHLAFGGDLVAYFVFNFEFGCVPITNDMIHAWGLTVSDLFKAASKNRPPLEYCSMFRMIAKGNALKQLKKMANFTGSDEEFIRRFDDKRMMVFRAGADYGASALLLYSDVLRQIRKETSKDIYIIPSSVHEVLICESDKPVDFDSMIQLVNRDVLEPNDFLSDHAYLLTDAGIISMHDGIDRE